MIRRDFFYLGCALFYAYIIFVLRVYRERKNSVYEEVKQNEILDEVESDNTFKPPYKRQLRKTAEIRKIQEFEHIYLDSADSIEKLIHTLHKNLFDTECIAELNASLLDSAKLLIRCRFNQVSDEMPQWYKENQELILSSFSCPTENKMQTWLTLSLYQCSVLLQMLRNSIYRSSPEALIGTALYLTELFDRAPAYFESVGLDKSEPYSVLVAEYEKLKAYQQSDDYALKLFQIVAKRDRNNINRIKSMLNDVYRYASERKKTGMQKQYEKYILFGISVCQSIRAVPYQYYDTFIEEFRSFRHVPENSLPSPEKMQEFRNRIPTDDEEVQQVYNLAYKEIYELFKYLPEKDYALISDKFICMIRSRMNIEYDFQYPEDMELEDVPLLRATKAVLAYIFVNFWGADPPED